MEEHAASSMVILPAWLSAILATIISGGFLGGAAWLFRMESRVTASETSLSYTKEGIARIESKLDRLLEER